MNTMSETSECLGCGSRQPKGILEHGYCPGCAEDCLCSACRWPCDPSYSLCDDCANIEREALDEEDWA
jgi:hypothetical protein